MRRSGISGRHVVVALAALLEGPQRSRRSRQNALAEQSQLGAAIPHAFDQLDPTDVPCTLARAPGRGQGGGDGVVVLAKALSQRLAGRKARTLGLLEPRLECSPIPIGQEGLDPALELVPLGQAGIGAQEALQGFRFRLAQVAGRLQEQP